MRFNAVVAALVLEAIVAAGVAIVALDIRAHRRTEELGGVNEWGYRGPVAHRRLPGEVRIVVVGGTRAFGWGTPGSALASQIRRVMMLTLDQPGRELRPVVVVNLARVGDTPEAYPGVLERFAYLKPDLVCVFDDLGVRGAASSLEVSGIYQLTGYAPALPLVLREKGMALRFGDVNKGYLARGDEGAALTGRWRRAAGRALEGVASGLDAVDRSIARLAGHEHLASDDDAPYGQRMSAVIDAAHRLAAGVVVAVGPAETAEQERRLAAVKPWFAERDASWLRVVDLGLEPRLRTESARIDGWNFSSFGITVAAESIAPALLSLVQAGT